MKKQVTISSILLIFIALALLVGKVTHTGINKPTIRYSSISNESIEQFKRMFQDGKHAKILFNMDGPWEWENESDLGAQQTEWDKEEDDLFVVYYHKDKDAIWQGYAQQILKCAHENIHRLEEVMGHYYYPSEMNGRKLPLYLTNSGKDYTATVTRIGGSSIPNSLGVTITSIGQFGCKTEAIVLHPDCFKVPPADINGYRKVLLHEMTHYVHRSSIDMNKRFNIFNWETEGIAEYCCERNERRQISDAERIDYIEKRCLLTGDFPSYDLAEYWAGESFFLFLDQTYGKEFVRDFIQNSINTSKDSLFIRLAHTAEEDHNLWVKRLRGINEDLTSPTDTLPFMASDSSSSSIAP